MARNKLTTNNLEAVGRMLTKHYGIRVVCQGGRCQTDGKTIYLPDLPDSFENKSVLMMIRSFLDHEVGHIVGDSKASVIKEAKEIGEDTASILNSIEDARCDNVVGKMWLGCGENIQAGVNHINRKSAGEEFEDEIQQLGSYLYFMTKDIELSRPVKKKIKNLCERHREELEAVVDSGACEDSLTLAKKIIDELGGEKNPYDPNDDECDGDESDADIRNNGIGSDMSNVIKKTLSNSSQASNALALEKYLTPFKQGLDIFEPVEIKELDRIMRTCDGRKSFNNFLHDISECSSILRQKMYQILKVNDKCWNRSGKKRGTISPRDISKLATGTSSRVFQRKIEEKNDDTDISLVIDNSGSMWGGSSPIYYAAVVSSALSTVMEALGFRVHAAGYDMGHNGESSNSEDYSMLRSGYRQRAQVNRVYKDWHEKTYIANQRIWSYITHSGGGGSTPTGLAMRNIRTHILSKSDAKRRIMLVLTDGYCDDPGAVLSEIENCKREDIDLVFIGILDDYVKCYPKYAVCEDLKTLGDVTLSQLSKALSL